VTSNRRGSGLRRDRGATAERLRGGAPCGGGLLAVPVLASGVDETCERPEHGVQGVPVEEIARLVGHSLTATTETVYRRELRPVMSTGAEVMDTNFKVG